MTLRAPTARWLHGGNPVSPVWPPRWVDARSAQLRLRRAKPASAEGEDARPGDPSSLHYTPAFQVVLSASTDAVSTKPEIARAKSLSEVTKTSAWSLVSATYSAS